MVFRKPYAFLIKYFRIINLFLSIMLGVLVYKLNLIRKVIDGIYLGKVTNYSTLTSEYIGLGLFLFIIFIVIIISLIMLLLKKKNKPMGDYLYNIIYLVLVFAYILSISNLFFTLDETLLEQTTLKLYTDISFLVIVPLFYFIVKYILIAIGFNLNKFNFTKDIIELKKEAQDNEEVELVFDKNNYKIKRSFRKTLREFKYYLLENKFIFTILIVGVSVFLLFTVLSLNIFNNSKVKINRNFVAANFNYKVNSVVETKYDLNNKLISDDNKYVIVNCDVKNLLNETKDIDLKRIRLVYGKDYSYATTYFNKFFYDFGNPYDNNLLKTGDNYNYILIFKVPISYKSNKYVLKFYDKNVYDNNEVKSSYKELKTSANKIDKNRSNSELKLSDTYSFNKRKYGDSSLSITGYEVKSKYVNYKNDKAVIIQDKNINNVLLVLDYKLELDSKYAISKYFNNDKDFFNKFTSISYIYNDNTYNDLKVNAIYGIDNKVMISVPYNVLNAKNITINIELRDEKVQFKLK